MDREAPALSVLASTQLCAPVATDVSLTFSCACRAPYLDCGLLGGRGADHVTWADCEGHRVGELKLLTKWTKCVNQET